MGHRAHVCTKLIVEYGTGFGNYTSHYDIRGLLLEIEEFGQKEQIIDGSLEVTEQTEIDGLFFQSKEFFDIVENEKFELFLENITEEKLSWLEVIVTDTISNKEHLIENGYIYIEWF